MAYIPLQNSVYLAAFAGALAGMASSVGPVSSTTPGDYAFLAQVADAFAQSFDTEYGAVNAGDEFQIELIAELCESVWSQRSVLPATSSTLPASYTAECDALVALVVDGSTQLTAQGVNPFGSEWQTYTPVFNTQNADGAIGDGAISGNFKIDGDTLFYSISLIWGTTTNGGTGFLTFSLPPGVLPDNAKMQGFGAMLSNGDASQTSVAGASFPLIQILAADLGPPVNAVVAFGISNSATGAFLEGASPFAWANTDTLLISGQVAIL